MAASSARSNSDEDPFFVVGCPRSGTTLLQRMLSAHPEVAVAPETFFVRSFWERQEQYGDLADDANLDRLVDDLTATAAFEEMGIDEQLYRKTAHSSSRLYSVLFGELLRQFARAHGAKRVGEKTPNHVLHISTLHRWFPEAQFVHVVRDPRAVVNSWRTVPWSSGYRWRDAEVWEEYVSAGREAEGRYRASVRSLLYEDLVQSPEEELQALCGFLDLEYDEQMLTFHEQEPTTVDVEREPWKARSQEPVDASVADRWREELLWSAQAQVEAVAGREMTHWGYRPAAPPWRRMVARVRALLERPVWKASLVLSGSETDTSPALGDVSNTSGTLTLGFLHVGASEHGVTRYGRRLSMGAHEHLDARVREASVEWARDPARHVRQLRAAVRSLSSADVIHLQYNERVWGESVRALLNVYRFTSMCDAALVVTLHDVRKGYGPGAILRRLKEQSTLLSSDEVDEGTQRKGERGAHGGGWGSAPVSLMRSVVKGVNYVTQEVANTLATRRLVRTAGEVLVCTHEEARRLDGWVEPQEQSVIPHYVEDRPRSPNRDKAKERLDLEDVRVLGVLGFIHRRKGYDLVVEVLSHLPDDIVAVFIGQPGRKSGAYVDGLERRATELGVADRLRITGYVDEGELDDYLAATDLALCPFRRASASGSLSTWIAAERPILASDLPLFAEYNERVPRAIATFDSFAPEPLANRVRELFNRAEPVQRERLRALRRSLALSEIMSKHDAVYRRVLGGEKHLHGGQ